MQRLLAPPGNRPTLVARTKPIMMAALPYLAFLLVLAGVLRLIAHYDAHDDGDPARKYTLRHLLGITFPLVGLIDCMILALLGNKKLAFDLLLLLGGVLLFTIFGMRDC